MEFAIAMIDKLFKIVHNVDYGDFCKHMFVNDPSSYQLAQFRKFAANPRIFWVNATIEVQKDFITWINSD